MYNTVMIVDDSKMDLMLNQIILETEHYAKSILSYSSPSEAINYLDEAEQGKQTFPDILFLDLNMPVLSGFDILNRFDAFTSPQSKECKIYVLSSSDDEEDIARLKTYKNVVTYLSKPLSNAELHKK